MYPARKAIRPYRPDGVPISLAQRHTIPLISVDLTAFRKMFKRLAYLRLCGP